MPKIETVAKPPAAAGGPRRTITTRLLDVERHGNNDYTVREVSLCGPLDGPMTVVGVKTLCAHKSRNVADVDYVRPWHRANLGPNLDGRAFE